MPQIIIDLEKDPDLKEFFRGEVEHHARESIKDAFYRDKTFKGLINEHKNNVKAEILEIMKGEFVIEGEYGPRFVGIRKYIEESIKRTINRPVNSEGLTQEEAPGYFVKSGRSWVEWRVQKDIAQATERIERRVNTVLSEYIGNAINSSMKKYVEKLCHRIEELEEDIDTFKQTAGD